MFGIISDTHYHLFNQFGGHVDDHGVNERLKHQLNATLEAANAMKAKGCATLIHCGDMFHVRGAVSPIVLNSVLETYRTIINDIGLNVFVLAGNHDLETNHSVFMANASSALEDLGVTVICSKKPVTIDFHVFASWTNSNAELLHNLKETADALGTKAQCCNAFIHAPLNQVIMGLPDSGIDPAQLAEMGFSAVFAGHYHNHKKLNDHVWSVGALTHHNWGDSQSKAGYVIVDGSTVTHFETSAPKFLDYAHIDDDSEVKGNYVRVSGLVTSDEEAHEARLALETLGAAGVVSSFVKTATVTAATSETSKIDSLDESVSHYANAYAKANDLHPERLMSLCLDILNEAEGLAE